MDISNSLFGLLKNNGLFKSEKQASFLTKFLANDLTYYTSFNYNLGSEYNFKSCGSSSFEFYCDNNGVKKIIKTTGTNKTSVYFERLTAKAFKGKQDKILADKIAYEDNRKSLDLLLEVESRYKKAINTCIKLLTIREFKNLGLADLVDTFKGCFTEVHPTDWAAQKEKHFNVNSRYTCLYNGYLKAVQNTYNFDIL